jgi:valyl-tRNA synthetase
MDTDRSSSSPEIPSAPSWPPRYEPREVEDSIFRLWTDRDPFRASPSDRVPYVIVIPPPNITGILTMGHVLNNTLQDILIRFRRMQGREALWLPGTDHAGIATQNVVEKSLAKAGQTRDRLGREEFVKKVWEWKEKYGGTIVTQLKKLGCSCDWSRERFTLDPGLSRAVSAVFVALYRKNLIYRGPYLVNWCPRCLTALSDEEVDHQEQEGALWYIRYPFADGRGHITVATTRPETMLGDTAVAVNPSDERYRNLAGRKIALPLTDRTIPVIEDSFVDPKFGTGAVKVTPAHDPNDFLIGNRHQLPRLTVMDTAGRMSAEAGVEFQGLDRFECREKIVGILKDRGLLEKTVKHQHAVGRCYRCRTVIEPCLSVQWFVRMKPLAAPALAAVREGKIKFYPRRWVKVYNHWMENIRDWCISRQLWWGHRIPAWYRGEEIHVGLEPPEGEGWRRDEDVLDTWFSSWLWPFSTLGWPDQTADLAAFYPTSTLVTGPDIIFFWVARMIMAGIEFMGEIPFREVYYTGIIRDMEGRKMSKSLGNSPDPLDVIRDYGADALRFTIARIAPIGQDVHYSNSLCELGRNFANKIWNASRLIASQIEGKECAPPEKDRGSLTLEDRAVLGKLQETVRAVTRDLGRFHFSEAALGLYDFFWHAFCDRYLEASKYQLSGRDERAQALTRGVMKEVLSVSLKLLHPFLPFITEEIWRRLIGGSLLSLSAWPRTRRSLAFPDAVALSALKHDLITAARSLRKDYAILAGREAVFIVRLDDPDSREKLAREAESMAALIRSARVEFRPEYRASGPVPSIPVSGGEIYMPLTGIVDRNQERGRCEKLLSRARSEMEGVEKRLGNADFLAKAPEEVRKKSETRREELRGEIVKLRKMIGSLGETG